MAKQIYPDLCEQEQIRRGELIAEVLNLKRDREHRDRYCTTWGTKTAMGLFLTIERLVRDGQ